MREPYERAAAFYHEHLQHDNHTIGKFHVSQNDCHFVCEIDVRYSKGEIHCDRLFLS